MKQYKVIIKNKKARRVTDHYIIKPCTEAEALAYVERIKKIYPPFLFEITIEAINQ